MQYAVEFFLLAPKERVLFYVHSAKGRNRIWNNANAEEEEEVGEIEWQKAEE